MSKRGRGRGTAPQKSVVAAALQAATSQRHGSMALPQKHGSVTALQKLGSEELFMECVDEDLAPSQKEAGRRAESEYQTAVQRVQTAKSAVNADSPAASKSSVLPAAHRGRGRPPKTFTAVTASDGRSVMPGGRGGARGRPPKHPVYITTTTTTATATANTGLSVKPGSVRGRGRGSSITAGRGRGRGQAIRNTSAPPSDGKLSPVVAVLVV